MENVWLKKRNVFILLIVFQVGFVPIQLFSKEYTLHYNYTNGKTQIRLTFDNENYFFDLNPSQYNQIIT